MPMECRAMMLDPGLWIYLANRADPMYASCAAYRVLFGLSCCCTWLLGGRRIATANNRDTAIQRDINRSLLYDIISEHHVLRVERDDIAELWEDVVAACYMSVSQSFMHESVNLLTSGQEVQRDNVISSRLVQGGIANSDVNESATDLVVWIPPNSDATADLEEAGDFLAVKLETCQPMSRCV